LEGGGRGWSESLDCLEGVWMVCEGGCVKRICMSDGWVSVKGK
jgi:hypothetical protein